MFNPNSIKTLRTLSANSQRTAQNKELLDEINQAIDDLKEWKKNETYELKKQLVENQQQRQIIYKSGYEMDDEDEIDDRNEEVIKQEADLNRRLQRIRNGYLKEYLQIPSYMSSDSKTQEVNYKLQKSNERLENMPQNKFDLNQLDDDILVKLTEWKTMITQFDENNKNIDFKIDENIDINKLKQEEQELEQKQQKREELSNNIKKELNELDKDFDEIDDLLNQCGIK